MALKLKAEIAVVIIILIAGYFAATSVIDRIRANAYAQAVSDTERKYRAQLDEQQKAADERLAKEVEHNEQVKKEAVEPEVIVKKLPEYISLPKPIYIQGPQSEAPPVVPGDAVIPQESIKSLFDFSVDCNTCQIQLAAKEDALAVALKREESYKRELDAANKKTKIGIGTHVRDIVIGVAGGIVIREVLK